MFSCRTGRGVRSGKFVQQRRRILQVRRVKAFGKTVVDAGDFSLYAVGPWAEPTIVDEFRSRHLRYNKGLPTRPRPPARISRALHGLLFKFHLAIKEQESPTVDTLLDFYKGYYQNPTRLSTDAQYVEGRKLLTRYYDSPRGQFRRCLHKHSG